jgi:hypothetical protein
VTFTLGLGVVFAVAVALLKYTRRLTWPTMLITFTAGVLLAGSTVGLMTRRAAEGGAQMVQTGVTAVSDAANDAGTAKHAPVKKAKVKP